jgi:hypothetical protein
MRRRNEKKPLLPENDEKGPGPGAVPGEDTLSGL